MAKARKSAKRTTTKTAAKRTTTRRASAARPRAKRASARRTTRNTANGMFDFVPSGWFKDVLASQTSRVIMAEALVAAAGAAAAVLVASRTESGQRAGQALSDGGTVMKEAALSAAAAARDVIGRGATEMLGSAAKSLLGVAEETQQDLAEKALHMRRQNEEETAQHDMAENVRAHHGRERQRDRPH